VSPGSQKRSVRSRSLKPSKASRYPASSRSCPQPTFWRAFPLLSLRSLPPLLPSLLSLCLQKSFLKFFKGKSVSFSSKNPSLLNSFSMLMLHHLCNLYGFDFPILPINYF
jgi:hypothetical protein